MSDKHNMNTILQSVLNFIDDIVCVTEQNMSIIYNNNKYTSFIKKHFGIYNDNFNMIDIIHNINDICYEMKKTCIIASLTKCAIDIYVNSITIDNNKYNIIKFCIVDEKKNTVKTDSKNLVAYMGHEIRNPIQVISTGVYIIDRYVRNSSPSTSLTNSTISNNSNSPVSPKNMNTYEDLKRSYLEDKEDINSCDDVSFFHDDETIDDNIQLENIDIRDKFEVNYDMNTNHKNSPTNILNCSIISHEITDNVLHRSDSLENINDICDTSVLKSVIKRVNNACKNMNIIINDILDLSKIDNDDLPIIWDMYSLRDITDLIYEDSIINENKKGLNMEYEIDETCPELIYTDNTRLFQILSNLISNSIKYSNTGTIRFNIKHNDKTKSIMFQIIDQGEGINKEDFPILFTKFGKITNNCSSINSTGLGLYVCQKIAYLLGGIIEVNSEHKKGSTFTLILPILPNNSNPEDCIKNNLTIPDTDNLFNDIEIKGNILIVDDDPNITSLFKLLLRCMNYDKNYILSIDTANTGDKAIYMSNNKKYDLIFMDIDLDGDDGCIVSKKILNIYDKLNISTIVIAVTANVKIQSHDNDVFTDIIIKPFNNEHIHSLIIKYLSSKQNQH